MATFALVIVARRLRPYFQAHLIKVIIDTPLKKILQRPDTLDHLMNWTVELSEFDIEYLPNTTIKEQVLADFITEFVDFPEEVQRAPQGKP